MLITAEMPDIIKAKINRPRSLSELRNSLKVSSLIARGNGRSYGDSSINETNTIVQITAPKIIGFFVAIIIGYISKNIILTIIAGLISYWIVIFLF